MEKLDEKKQTPLDSDQENIKADLEEMKKWADDSRKRQKSSLVSNTSSKSTKKHEAKPKHEARPKHEVKENTVKKAETTPKATVKSTANKKPNAQKAAVKQQTAKTAKQAPTKKPVNKQNPNNQSKQRSKTPSSDKTAEKKSSFDQKLKDLKNRRKKPSGGNQEHNYLLWATIAVIVIPCLIILYIIIGSRENSRTPVEGDRFEVSLDPAITEENLTALKESLQFDNADAVEITLKSATLRVNIDTKDDLSQEEIKKIVELAYEKVNEKLPITTYFTNKKNGDEIMKMYDLEISAYNILPEADAEDNAKQIHLSRTKNAAAENAVDDVLSSPKDEQSANEILHPDTSNPPKQEAENEQKEGE